MLIKEDISKLIPHNIVIAGHIQRNKNPLIKTLLFNKFDEKQFSIKGNIRKNAVAKNFCKNHRTFRKEVIGKFQIRQRNRQFRVRHFLGYQNRVPNFLAGLWQNHGGLCLLPQFQD